MSKRSGPRTKLGVIVSWKRCMQDHQVGRVGSLYSETASFSVSRRSTTKQGAHRLTTSTQLNWLMSCYSTYCWPKGAWVLARSKNSWNHAYKFSALFWFPFFVSRKEVFWDLYQTETLWNLLVPTILDLLYSQHVILSFKSPSFSFMIHPSLESFEE